VTARAALAAALANAFTSRSRPARRKRTAVLTFERDPAAFGWTFNAAEHPRMSIKALSPLFALSCLSGLALAFGCSDPPEAATPPAANGGMTTGGTPATTAGNSAGGASAGMSPTAGAAGQGTAGATGGGGAGTAGAGGTPASGGAPPTYPGYTITINENFDAPIDLDKDKIWTWSDGGLNEGQVRYVKEAITFGDGLMKITTSKPAAMVPGGQSFAENTPNLKSFPLTSAEFRTKYNNYRYGRYEARMKAPVPVAADMAQGNFINTLFTFRTPKIEDWREIDIEIIGGGVDKVFSNIVYGDNKQDYGQTFNTAKAVTVPAGFNTRSAFHTYAFVWTADSIEWFVDDQPARSYPKPAAGGAGSPPIPDKSAKIMMSMWVFQAPGYDFGGVDGAKNAYPFTAEYDYFRFYKKDDDIYPMDPAALPAEDKNQSKNNPNETDTMAE
jgi:beta-glucanase (GH16 family)